MKKKLISCYWRFKGEYDVQVLQQPLRGREEGAAPVLCAAEAGRAGPRHRQTATRHPPDARHL